jgi:hypothetical protein
MAFRVLAALLVANTFVGLSLTFSAKYFLPKASAEFPPCEALSEAGVHYHAPAVVCWFAGHFIAIQFILVALMALTLLIFRKRLRYIPRR